MRTTEVDGTTTKVFRLTNRDGFEKGDDRFGLYFPPELGYYRDFLTNEILATSVCSDCFEVTPENGYEVQVAEVCDGGPTAALFTDGVAETIAFNANP